MRDRELLAEGEVLRLNDWAVPALWCLGVAAGLAGLFLVFVDPLRHGALDGPLRPLLGLAWLGFGAIAGLGARAGLIVDQEGITVRPRYGRSKHFAWDEIEEFVLRRSFGGGALRIRLRDGRQLRAVGFEARSAEESTLAEDMVAELNRRVAAATASSQPR